MCTLTQSLSRDIIQILLSFRSLTSRICAFGQLAVLRHTGKKTVSDKRSEPTDLHDSSQAYIPNPVPLKGCFDRLTQLL